MKAAYFWLIVSLVVCGLVGIAAFFSPPGSVAAAGPWYVAQGGDDGDDCLGPSTPCGSINGALAKASSGDTIYVAEGVFTGSGAEVLLIDKNASILGGWDYGFTAQVGLTTIEGEHSRRGVTVNYGAAVSVDRFLIEDGWVSGPYGAGILNKGQLVLSSCRLEGNGIDNQHFPGSAEGVLTIQDCVLEASHVNNSDGTLVIERSAILHSPNFGIANSHGEVTVDRSCIASNAWEGLNNIQGNVVLLNSTISQNGGIGFKNWSNATATVHSSTIVRNQDWVLGGGGIYNSETSSLSIENTVLAENQSDDGPDCKGELSSGGYNILGDDTGCTFNSASGDQLDTIPLIGELIGTPCYHPLLELSPARESGNPTGCRDHLGSLLATDERGVPRSGICDSGAYEYAVPGSPAKTMPYSGTPQHAPPGIAFLSPLMALVTDSVGSPIDGESVLFVAPASGASATFEATGTRIMTAATNGSGIATSSVVTANLLAGSYVVEASVTGVPEPAEFDLANLVWYVKLGGDDSADCQSPATACATVNGALGKSTDGDTIYIAEGTYTGSGQQVVLLENDILLLGGWDPGFNAQLGVTILDGQNARRGITIPTINNTSGEVTATVDHISVINGAPPLGWPYGGGLLNYGILTLQYSSIAESRASKGGGLFNGWVADVRSSEFHDNTATRDGGGGVYNDLNATVTIWGSTIDSNTSDNSGGYGQPHGAGIYNQGILNLDNSTLSGNQAIGSGGGIYNYSSGTTLRLRNATVSNNSASNGGGIFNSGGPATTDVTLHNSLIAGNTATSGPDCSGGTYNGGLGHNIIGDSAGCTFTPGPGDRLDVGVNLGPLQDNGGPTLTHALQPQCPMIAINAGNPAGCTDHLGDPLSTDQRGMPRVGACDIGAYEYQGEVGCLFLPCVLRNYCPPLYRDDFSAPSSGWPIQDTGNVVYEYLSGEYRILLRSNYWWAAATSGFTAADYIVEADVRNAASPFGTYGLLFGLSTDWHEFYEFEIGSDGTFGVYKYDHDAWTDLGSGTSGAINTGTASNRIKVLREGATIKAYANGTLLTTVADGSFTGSRRLGVIAFSHDQTNVDVRYDNFTVYPVTCTGLGGLAPSGQFPARATTDGDIWKEGPRFRR